MNCNGKCYLSKLLSKKSQENESKQKGLVIKESMSPVFFVEFKTIHFNKKEIIFPRENFSYLNYYKFLIDKKKDIPPIFS